MNHELEAIKIKIQLFLASFGALSAQGRCEEANQVLAKVEALTAEATVVCARETARAEEFRKQLMAKLDTMNSKLDSLLLRRNY